MNYQFGGRRFCVNFLTESAASCAIRPRSSHATYNIDKAASAIPERGESIPGLVETVRRWWSSCQEILTDSGLGTGETMHNRSRYTLSEATVIKLLTGRATRKSPGGPLATKLPGSTCLQVTVDR